MKKAMFVLGLGLLGSASAQIVTTDVVAGPSYSVMGGVSFTGTQGLNLGVMFSDFANINGQGLTGRVLADFNSFGTTVNVNGFLTFPTGVVDIYAGPGISIGIGTGVFAANLIGGALFPLTSDLNLYGEGGFRLGAGGTGIFRAGLAYEF